MAGELPRDCPWRPNFFIVGAPKCGTTSLADYLGQHPDIFISAQKEPLFFCTDHVHREPWRVADPESYVALFEPGKDCKRRGEASVWYLASRAAAERIYDANPQAKIIVMLRNPVDMAVSLHAQFLFSGNENIGDFEKAYAAQSARAAGRHVPWRAHMPAGLLYTEIGRYAPQIERYLELFPRDQVQVLIFEDYFADLAAGYRATLRFLEVDPEFVPDFAVKNERHRIRNAALQRFLTKAPEFWDLPARLLNGPARQKWSGRFERLNLKLHHYNNQGQGTTLADDMRRQIHADFADDIARLEELLDRDLSVWTRRNLGGSDQSATRQGQGALAAVR